MRGVGRPSPAAVLSSLILVIVVAGFTAGIVEVARDPGPDPVGTAAMGLAFAAFGVVGALLVARRPSNSVGWLFSAIGVLAMASGVVEAAANDVVATVAAGGSPRGWTMLLGLLGQLYWYPFLGLFLILLPLLFPTGKALSRRWAVLGWAGMACLTGVSLQVLLSVGSVAEYEGRQIFVENPIGFLPFTNAEEQGVGPILIQLALVGVVGAWASMVARYRRSDRVGRLQLKWLLFALSVVLAEMLIDDLIWTSLLGHENSIFGDTDLAFAITVAGIPVSAGIAVLRYKLYEIDRIASRTVTYSLLAIALAAVYAGGVIALQTLLPASGDLAIAGSTLVAAALFNPLRRRVQHWVDRRFNRRRYDAEKVVEVLGVRLRDAVDSATIIGDLRNVVTRTVEPVSAAVWVRGEGQR